MAIAETREEDDDECDYKENNAQNDTGPMPSSALDVPGLPPLPRAPSDHDEVAASSIMIKKTTVKQLPYAKEYASATFPILVPTLLA